MHKLSALAVAVLVGTCCSTNTAEIKILSANGALVPQFERETNNR